MASPAPQFRPLPDQLRDILLAHAKYLEGQAGSSAADLTGQDLHFMDLTAYRLDGAILKNANLKGTYFTGTTNWGFTWELRSLSRRRSDGWGSPACRGKERIDFLLGKLLLEAGSR